MQFLNYYNSHTDIVDNAFDKAYKKLFVDDLIEKPLFEEETFKEFIHTTFSDFYYMLYRDYINEFVKEVISILSKEQDFDINDYSDTVSDAIHDLFDTHKYEFEDVKPYQQIIVDYYASKSDNEVNSIINNEDNIGDTISVTDLDSVDVWNRDYAFVYLDGKVSKGEIGQSHAQLLNSVLESDDFDFKRPKADEILNKTNSDSVAFGSVINNIGFIDACENCSINNVAEAAKSQLKLSKVYTYPDNDKITRLAKAL